MSQRFPQHNPDPSLAAYGIHIGSGGGLPTIQPTTSPLASARPGRTAAYAYKPPTSYRSQTASRSPSPSRFYTAGANTATTTPKTPPRPARSSSPSPSRQPKNTLPRISSRPSSPLIPTPSTPPPIPPTSSSSFSTSFPTKPMAATSTSTSTQPTGRSHRRHPWLPLSVLIASATFAVTAWFARATFSNHSSSSTRDFFKTVFRIDITDTLTCLALLSGILAFLLGFVIDNVLDVVQWALICRSGSGSGPAGAATSGHRRQQQQQGASVLTILAISGTTGVLGTLGLLIDRYTPASARLWASGKLALRIAVWISGIALFINTSLATVYRSEFTYAALAGVGPFDGSLVPSFLADLNARNANLTVTSIPYSVSALAHNLVVNPQHAIASPHETCNADLGCDSYILPGGLATANPLPPTNSTELPVITLGAVPATRVDFVRTIAANDTALTVSDCDLFAQQPYMIALRFCLAPSSVRPGAVQAAIYVCDLGTNHTTGECLFNRTLHGGSPPTINTTFSIARLSTSTVVSRANYSILALTRPDTEPIPDHSLADTTSATNLAAYRAAINWLLNNTAAGIPAPSGIVEYFWSAPLQLSSDYWSPGPRQAFESLLAYPLWFWQANNLGNVALQRAGNGETADAASIVGALRAVLGDDYLTEAGVGGPAVRIVVDEGMFIAFVVLVGSVLVVGWLVVGWLWVWGGRGRRGGGGSGGGVKIPKISSYPAVEIGLRTREGLAVGNSGGVAGFSPNGSGPGLLRLASGSGLDIVNAGDKGVRRALRGRRVVFDGVIEDALPFGSYFGRTAGGGVKTTARKSNSGKIASSGTANSGSGGLTP